MANSNNNNGEIVKWVVIGGIAYLAYDSVIAPIFEFLGLKKDAQEKAQSQSDNKAIEAQKRARNSIPKGARRQYAEENLKSMARQLTQYSSGFSYNYAKLVNICAYFSGFTNADAVSFLSFFAEINNYTAYQWYLDKFENATNLNVLDVATAVNKYLANYKHMGYDPRQAQRLLLTNPVTHVNKITDYTFDTAIAYLYKVAKIGKQ